MVRLFERFRYTIEEDLKALFSKKEQEGESPVSRLSQYIREAEKQTETVEKLLKRQQLLKEKLEQQQKETLEMLEKRRKQLNLAEQGDEIDLINFAKQEVESYENRLATLKNHYADATNAYIELEQKFETMKHKIKDMKVRHLELLGKENVKQANEVMDGILTNDSMNDPSASLNQLSNQKENNEQSRLEERLNQLEQIEKIENHPSEKE